jgi:hypothetical protein
MNLRELVALGEVFFCHYMHVSMVVNQLECCGINNNNSLKKKKMVVNESHAPTKISFVAKSLFVVLVVPIHSPNT